MHALKNVLLAHLKMKLLSHVNLVYLVVLVAKVKVTVWNVKVTIIKKIKFVYIHKDADYIVPVVTKIINRFV